jgi:hypothetical protein
MPVVPEWTDFFPSGWKVPSLLRSMDPMSYGWYLFAPYHDLRIPLKSMQGSLTLVDPSTLI